MTLQDIDDFDAALNAAKSDTVEPLAEITALRVARRDAVPEAKDFVGGGEDREKGLVVRFVRQSGAAMDYWFPCPGTWEPHHDIVALLSYLHIDPTEGSVEEMVGEEVPVRYDDGDGWKLDWDIIGDADLPERMFR